jgi:hypothetical protein
MDLLATHHSRLRKRYIADADSAALAESITTARTITIIRRALDLSYYKPEAEAADRAGVTLPEMPRTDV